MFEKIRPCARMFMIAFAIAVFASPATAQPLTADGSPFGTFAAVVDRLDRWIAWGRTVPSEIGGLFANNGILIDGGGVRVQAVDGGTGEASLVQPSQAQ